ncbi:hypothetical protein B9479_000440 [Cryptococcus floricola]|uniref:Uncharacterized protein n=1 Tax=Cryptococcus floricola TaxID=2591691 RepID=A0A5D3B8R6_9TREE|nr:hypothetical protein B9479_000440 [Cryptococcus floricola]
MPPSSPPDRDTGRQVGKAERSGTGKVKSSVEVKVHPDPPARVVLDMDLVKGSLLGTR